MNPLEALRAILIKELDLAESQVNFYNQKWDIPADDLLYISIGVMSSKPYANAQRVDAHDNGYKETKRVNYQDIVSIDVFSRSTKALFERHRILHALVSQHAQELQEKYSFKIGSLPSSFNDLSELEASAYLYRFQIVIQILGVEQVEKEVAYYDSFEGKVITETQEAEFVQQTEE